MIVKTYDYKRVKENAEKYHDARDLLTEIKEYIDAGTIEIEQDRIVSEIDRLIKN
jgi:hypothetical protein